MQYKKNWKPKRKKYYQFKFESNKDKLRSLYFWVEDFTKNKVIWYPTIFPSLFIKWRFHWRFKKVLKNLVTFKLCFHSMLGMWRDLRESPIGQWHISSVLSGPGAWTAWTLPDCNIWYQPRQTGHWSVLTEFFLVTCLITGQGINGCSLRTFFYVDVTNLFPHNLWDRMKLT